MIRLHNMNRTHTFIDVESGQFISLPKDETDKPPVNADINNNIDTFHSTGSEGTPTEPIDIVNISEYNKTVCGRNFFNTNHIVSLYRAVNQNYAGFELYEGYDCFWLINGFTMSSTIGFVNIPFKQNTRYTMSFYAKTVGSSGTAYRIYYSDGTNSGDISVDSPIFAKYVFTSAPNKTIVRIAQLYYSSYSRTYYHSFQLVEGSYTELTLPAYTPHTGKTYPYKLEDTDGVLHYGGDLPDGTADSFNGKEFVEKTLKYTLNSTAEILGVYDVYSKPNSEVFYIRNSTLFGSYSSPLITSAAVRCTHFIYTPDVRFQDIQGCCAAPYVNPPVVACRINDSVTGIVKTDTEAEKLAKVKSWLTGQINAGTPPVFSIGLTTPQTYTIKQYGETYGGVVWEYNEKPKSIQYHTNIFTDKNITMQCEVRKLGNRKMSEFYWVTENGDKIITENGDYIMLEY